MKRSALFIGLVALACVSCGQNYRDTALYQQSGRHKAIVTILPVIDRTEASGAPWDLSHEFTSEIRKRVDDSQSLYLLREEGTAAVARALATPNPADLIKPDLGAAEFVVVSELLEQKLEPFGRNLNHAKGETGAIFSIAMRLRVIDLRDDEPKVVLQEVIDHEHLVARPYLNTDYAKSAWGMESFERTPMGIAHHHLLRECVARIEGYIEATR